MAASLALSAFSSFALAANIPATRAEALDGRTVSLPQDLPAATILIVGFGRHSSDATTSWEKPTHAQFARFPGVTFYDMAMLASVPNFARGFVTGRVRKAVPSLLHPNFLILTEHEPEWKQIAGFDPRQENAAYVMLIDRTGTVHWSTHASYTPALFDQLAQATRALAAK